MTTQLSRGALTQQVDVERAASQGCGHLWARRALPEAMGFMLLFAKFSKCRACEVSYRS